MLLAWVAWDAIDGTPVRENPAVLSGVKGPFYKEHNRFLGACEVLANNRTEQHETYLIRIFSNQISTCSNASDMTGPPTGKDAVGAAVKKYCQFDQLIFFSNIFF